jgi:hypothetical protein
MYKNWLAKRAWIFLETPMEARIQYLWKLVILRPMKIHFN